MSEAKHTPGPWTYEPPEYGFEYNDNEGELGGFLGPDGKYIMGFGHNETYYNSCGEPPSPSDARLIAAAPDMLEALKAMRDDPTIQAVCASPLWAQMVNAIEKAEGKAK